MRTKIKKERVGVGKSSSSSDTRHAHLAKVLCLLAAVVIWLYVMNVENPDYEQTIESVPVTIINSEEIEIDNSLTIYSGYDVKINATVQGRKNLVSNITADDIKLMADVSGITEAGKYTLDIKAVIPDGVKLVSMSSDTITVFIDKKESIDVELGYEFTNFILETGSGFSLGEPVISVDTVTVTGPSRYLADISRAVAKISVLERVSSSMTVYCDITLVDSDGDTVTNPYVSKNPSTAKVEIPVYAEKDVPLTVEYKYGYFNDDNVDIKILPETIKVKGDASVITALDSIVIMAINEKKVTKDVDVSTVTLSMPEGVENVDNVQSATVTISQVGTTTRTMALVIDKDDIINSNGVEYELLSDTVNVTFRGKATDLFALSPMNVKVTIDLSSYTSSFTGVVTIPLEINIRSSGVVYEIGEYNVQVKIY